MTILAIRDTIVTYFDPLFLLANPGVQVVYDNGPFDYNNPPDTYLELSIEISDGQQMSAVGENPPTRYYGTVYATVTCREGTGVRNAMSILDSVIALLKYQSLPGCQLLAPRPTAQATSRGWYSMGVKFPLHADFA